MPPKTNNGPKARSSANPATAQKPKAAAKASPNARCKPSEVTTTTTRTVTTIVKTTESTPTKNAKPKAAPKPKDTTNKTAPKTKAAPKAASSTSKSKSKAASTQARTEPFAKASPKPKTPKAPKTVHDVLFRVGTKLSPIPAPPTTGAASQTLASALPRGTGVVSLAESDSIMLRLALSLQSKLGADVAAPMQAADSFRSIGAQGRAVDALLNMPAAWSPARKWPTRAWTRFTVEHCPLFADAVSPSGTKACFVTVPKAQLAALCAEARKGAQIPIAKGVVPLGPEVHTAMQIFYAMHTEKWNMVLLMDETSFVGVYKDGTTLTLSSAISIIKPKVISLLGAMLELVRLGRNRIPEGVTAKKPTKKQTARAATAAQPGGGGEAGFDDYDNMSEQYYLSDNDDHEHNGYNKWNNEDAGHFGHYNGVYNEWDEMPPPYEETRDCESGYMSVDEGMSSASTVREWSPRESGDWFW